MPVHISFQSIISAGAGGLPPPPQRVTNQFIHAAPPPPPPPPPSDTLESESLVGLGNLLVGAAGIASGVIPFPARAATLAFKFFVGGSIGEAVANVTVPKLIPLVENVVENATQLVIGPPTTFNQPLGLGLAVGPKRGPHADAFGLNDQLEKNWERWRAQIHAAQDVVDGPTPAANPIVAALTQLQQHPKPGVERGNALRQLLDALQSEPDLGVRLNLIAQTQKAILENDELRRKQLTDLAGIVQQARRDASGQIVFARDRADP